MTRPFPILVCDDSFNADPRGIRAFSYDDHNAGLPHPIPVGTLVWTRDMAEPVGTETLARIGSREKDGWPPPYWLYYLLPLPTTVRVADLSAAVGCSVQDMLGA